MLTGALGLIEVIGYPPAIEAADAALKAANVKLASITKVDGGIMTVQILGDVGAVQAAVAAAGLAASRVGPLRATHVIPRVDAALFDTVLKLKTNPPKSDSVSRTNENDKTSQITVNHESNEKKEEAKLEPKSQVKDQTKDEEEEVKIILPPKMPMSKEVEIEDMAEDLEDKQSFEERVEALQSKSNSELRALITTSGIKIPAKKLNATKKQDLINILTDFYKNEEGEA